MFPQNAETPLLYRITVVLHSVRGVEILAFRSMASGSCLRLCATRAPVFVDASSSRDFPKTPDHSSCVDRIAACLYLLERIPVLVHLRYSNPVHSNLPLERLEHPHGSGRDCENNRGTESGHYLFE